MHSDCAVLGSCMLLILSTFQPVTGDEIPDKSVTSSPLMSTTQPGRLWPSNLGDKSPDLLTMRDISNAFHVVVNDSNEIKQLIPTMFNLSSADPTYVFRLPQSAKRSYLTMRKSDFVQPIFPNLTISYVRLMKNKDVIMKDNNRDDKKPFKSTEDGDNYWWNQVNPNSLEEDDPTLILNLQTERNFIEYLNEVNQESGQILDKKEAGNDEWSLLGLHGWKGVLSTPKKGNRPHLNDDPKTQKPKPNGRPVHQWDLPGRMQDNSLKHSLFQAMKNTSIFKIIGNLSQTTYPITSMHDAHSDEDVYIGRVNDPFGQSTKWNVKNSSNEDTQTEDRKKRAVIELYSMIKCSTGCDPIVYKGYGCYCGFLGDGQSVDGIDQCCKLHDKCYENTNCISYLEYFVPYIWKCYRGKPLCAIDHGEWGGPNSCAARLCKCDLTLSRCLRQFVCPQRRALCRTSKARLLQNLLFNF